MSKTKTTKKFKLNPIAIVALVLCALIAVYCGTTAWITSGSPINPLHLTQLDDFKFTISPSSNGALTYTYTFENGTNNIDEINSQLAALQFSVTKAGNGVAFARFRISHEWLATKDGNTTRLQGEYNLPFNLADSSYLLDNRLEDGYVYYIGAIPKEPVTIFNGFDMSEFDTSAFSNYDSVTLNIDFTVDAVQFNRYRQFWGIANLPWRS